MMIMLLLLFFVVVGGGGVAIKKVLESKNDQNGNKTVIPFLFLNTA